MSAVTIQGVTMTIEAARNAEETSCSPAVDLLAIRARLLTEASLLAQCLSGADEDRVEGWRDYVHAVVTAAGAR